MLENEYMTLMGYDENNISESFIYEFDEANATYMACSDSMDKAEFCSDWKKHMDSTIILDLTSRVQRLEGKVKELREIRDKTVEELMTMMSSLQCDFPEANTLSELWEHIDYILDSITSRKVIVNQKLKAGVDLNEKDILYVEENLK